LTERIFVFRGPETFKYSHDRMAKKKAPMNSSHNALSVEEIDNL
jgi:hypothetical protein